MTQQQPTETPGTAAPDSTSAPTDQNMHPEFAERKIRLAVVMTGGVSLAVWIGGVAAEIHRAVRGDGIYGSLNGLLRTNVEVDVITGASAGGVNGAFLATAIAFPIEVDNRFNELLNTWAGDGRVLEAPATCRRVESGESAAGRLVLPT